VFGDLDGNMNDLILNIYVYCTLPLISTVILLFVLKSYFIFDEVSDAALSVVVYIFLGFVFLFWIYTGIDFLLGKPNLISSIVLGSKFKPYHLLILTAQLILPMLLFVKSIARKHIGVLLIMFLFNLPYYMLTLIQGVTQIFTKYNPEPKYNWILDFPSFGLKDIGLGFVYAILLLGALRIFKRKSV
jgi:hypothetical protein